MLNESGGVIDDLIVYFVREDWFRVVVNASTADKELRDAAFAVERLSGADYAARRSRDHRGAGPTHARSSGSTPSTRDAPRSSAHFCGRSGDLFVAALAIQAKTVRSRFASQMRATMGTSKPSASRKPGLAHATLALEAGMNLYRNDMTKSSRRSMPARVTVDLKTRAILSPRCAERDGARRALVGLKLLDRGVLRSHQMSSVLPAKVRSPRNVFATLQMSIAWLACRASQIGRTVQVECAASCSTRRLSRCLSCATAKL